MCIRDRTYDGSRRIRELATTLPLEALVLETDAPDIPPVWLQRGRNAPAELPRMGGILAELRGTTEETIAAGTRAAVLDLLPELANLSALPDSNK